jgi:hypothetical protein
VSTSCSLSCIPRDEEDSDAANSTDLHGWMEMKGDL